MFILDTDTISVLVRRPPARLLRQLRAVPAGGLFTTAITIAEIYYGLYRIAERRNLQRQFEELVFPNLTILPFDGEAGKLAGILRARLERQGRVVSEPDLRIAAIALRHNYTLITGNTRHFTDIPGLKQDNWIR